MSDSNASPRPPALAAWLLRVCLGHEHGSIVGDLDEEFQDHVEAYGPFRARLIYRSHVFRTIPPLTFQTFFWQSIMLKNYLTITLRTLRKHKGFSAINIVGLAVSMAVCLLIILFIRDQRQADQFHTHKDRIYRVNTQMENRRGIDTWATTPATLPTYLRDTYTHIEAVTQVHPFGDVVAYGERRFGVNGLYVEPAFFEIFDFDLHVGNSSQALAEPNTMVLSQETAQKVFGDTDPLGKSVTLNGGETYVVTGLLTDTPNRSHFNFEALVSAASLPTARQPNTGLLHWQNTVQTHYTYLLLQDGVSASAFEAQLPDLIANHYNDGERITIQAFQLQPLTAINLGPALVNPIGLVLPGVVVYFLGALAIIVMLTACFNYMSLSVARSLKRSKEVGLRKVFGAHRSQIIKQFLSEAVVVALLSLALSYILLLWLVPQFNSLWFVHITESTITPRYTDYMLLLMFVGFSVGIGLLAGLYPALYLSAFRPAQTLRGLSKIRGFSRLTVRKLLVVGQFALSLLFIVTALVFYRQSGLMLAGDYGFDKEHIINVALQDVPYERFRNAILQQPGIVTVSAMTPVPGTGTREGVEVLLPGETDAREGVTFSIDEHVLDNLALTLKAGRNFSASFASDAAQSIIVNETALHAWDLGTPDEAVGQTVRINNRDVQIVGVVEDFHFEDFLEPIRPLVLRSGVGAYSYANVRVQPNATQNTIAYLESTWGTFASAYPIEYAFFDEQLEERYAFLKDLMGTFGLTAGLAVLIACLGLLGMASYATETRLREVGVRKVLGASVRSIMMLLSREFLILVGIAIVIAAPLAWYVNDLWLQEFALRVSMDAGSIIVSVFSLVVIALLTIGSQTFRAALTNPVETLRSE